MTRSTAMRSWAVVVLALWAGVVACSDTSDAGDDAGTVADAAGGDGGGGADLGDGPGSDAAGLDATIDDALDASGADGTHDAAAVADAADDTAGDAAAADAGDDVDDTADDDTADGAGLLPIVVVPGPPVSASVKVLDAGTWQRALPLVGNEVLVYRVEKDEPVVALLGPLDSQMTPLAGALVEPDAAVVVGEARLVRHAAGLAALVGKVWLPSPLGAALPGPIEAWRVGAGGEEVWIVAGGALHLWRKGKVATIPSLKVSKPAMMAFGCPGPAGAALWLNVGPALLAVSVDAAGKAEVSQTALAQSYGGAVCDAAGALWVAADDALYRRAVGGQVQLYALGAPVTSVFGPDGGEGFWLRRAGAPWRVDGDVFREVLGLPAATTWTAAADGSLVAVTGAGVVRAQTKPPPPKPKIAWKADIYPIYKASCALCHGPDGVSTKLHTAQKWQDSYAKILQYVEAGVMPLSPVPKLDSAAIATIKSWKLDGFLE